MMACGDHVRGATQEVLSQKVKKLDREKSGINNWARHVIKGKMIEAARKKNVLVNGVKVKYFRDIGNAWVESQMTRSVSDETDREMRAKRVFNVIQGVWDMNKGWALTMEEKFMRWKKITYIDQTENTHRGKQPKGIIERLISYQKLQMVKSIMRPANRRGVGTLSVRPTKDELVGTGQRRNTNRTKGGFDMAYLKRGREQLSLPDSNCDEGSGEDGSVVKVWWLSDLPSCESFD